MGAKGMVLFIAIVVLLFPLAATRTMVSESHKDGRILPLGNEGNFEEMTDKETVELLWTTCGEEFTYLVEALQDLASNNIDQATYKKERLLLTCLNENNINISVSIRDKCIRKWYMDCLDPFLPMPKRRKLFEANCYPHCIKDTLKDDGRSSSTVRDIEPIPFPVSKAETGAGGGIDTTTIIIVVVSTAMVTFLLATLIFCWYTKTYGGVQIDEKPLLSLSRNENSNGITQKGSFSYHNSVKNPGNDQLLSNNISLQKKDSSVNSSVSLGMPLQPLPSNLSASGIAPLKPPPGRPDLALKTPPGIAPVLNTSSPPISPKAAAPPTLNAKSMRVPSARKPPPPPPPAAKAPPPPPPMKKGPAPPPPPGGVRPPPKPPGAGFKHPRASSEKGDPDGEDANKAKLKPFFWDKVMANQDQAMVWHQIRAGSFQFNEEMIENLFGYNAATEKTKGTNKKPSSQDPSSNMVQIIDGKKAQNLSILLKALNVTTNEVCDALKEGNELPIELIQTLLKMAPTGEEELKLRLYNGDLSRLGTAERFLKKLVEIPFAYKRLESLLFMCTLQEEEDIIKESFQTLEAACVELKKSRLFLKLLEAVLKTGNRMNDGTFRGSAQAFKLDTLLKLADVKGVDGKTTLLHFVVQEIIRAEGIRTAKNNNLVEDSSDEYYRNLGLEVVSCLSNELEDVKRSAVLDSDGLTGTVSKFGNALLKAREFLNTDLKSLKEGKEGDEDDEDDDEFSVILSNFVQDAEKGVMWMLEEEKRIMALVKSTADYFHGQAGKDEGLRLFVIVRDFLIILDKVCKEIKANPLVRPQKSTEVKEELSFKTEEMKDDSSSKITETKDGVEPGTKQAEDSKEPGTKHIEDGVEPGKKQTEDGEEAGTKQTEDRVEPGTKQTEDGEEPGTKQTEDGKEPGTKQTEDGVEPEKKQPEDGEEPGTKQTEDSVEPGTKQTEDSVEPRTTQTEDVAEPRTKHTEDVSSIRGQDRDDLQNETAEIVDSKHKSQGDDDLRHETREANGSPDETQEDDESQPLTRETDESQHEPREAIDSNKRENDDDDDDTQSRMHEDDDLQHKTEEDDDSQPKTEKKDIEETSERSLGPNPTPLRIPNERLIPAIALRRVDTFSSSSSSEED